MRCGTKTFLKQDGSSDHAGVAGEPAKPPRIGHANQDENASRYDHQAQRSSTDRHIRQYQAQIGGGFSPRKEEEEEEEIRRIVSRKLNGRSQRENMLHASHVHSTCLTTQRKKRNDLAKPRANSHRKTRKSTTEPPTPRPLPRRAAFIERVDLDLDLDLEAHSDMLFVLRIVKVYDANLIFYDVYKAYCLGCKPIFTANT